MKRTMSFRLSDEAENILKRKALALSLNKTAVLETMIQEFSPSTREEKLRQKEDRKLALRAFLDTKSRSIEKAWRNGFSNGWMQFQGRKTTSFFRVSKVSQSLMAK